MRFMYQYPDLTGVEGDMLDSGPVAGLARAAEDAGWDGFAFTEHPAPGLRWLQTGGHQTLDPFVALGYRQVGRAFAVRSAAAIASAFRSACTAASASTAAASFR